VNAGRAEMVKQWIVYGRFEFNGHALVQAETEEEAKAAFDRGEFEFDHPTSECINWERTGRHPKLDGMETRAGKP
jgi:hypothetical protein